MGRAMDQPKSPAEKLRMALDLFDTGVDLMRQNLRRRHPSASEAEIAALLAQWLRTLPGAEQGDAPGRLRDPARPGA